MRYDIAIVGSGPAGLEAAITAKIRNKNILLIGDKNSSAKVYKAHEIKNYLGIPNIPGNELAKAFLEHAQSMGVDITEDRIASIYAMGSYFMLQGGNENYEADALILATGVVNAKPIEGEEEYLGKGVSYCATCDAALYRGKKAVVIGYSPKEEAEADFLAEGCEKVYYIPQYKDEVHVSDKVEVLSGKPVRIVGDRFVTGLVIDSWEEEIEADGVFVLREAISPGQLVPGLETKGAHVVVDRKMATNIKGCFACGDITGEPYQYIKSAGEGNVAALSAVGYLTEVKRNG